LRRATIGDLPAVTALQQAAYAQNRALLGVEPLPLLAEYREIFAQSEVWLADEPEGLGGVLILQVRPDDLLIWSVATAPFARSRGLGNRMLACAESRAREFGRTCIRLYTGKPLVNNIAWYTRRGYVHERTEDMGDRVAVHLMKQLNIAGDLIWPED
jgi:ribosomal protein S18 acetylase RimI-like enzyme